MVTMKLSSTGDFLKMMVVSDGRVAVQFDPPSLLTLLSDQDKNNLVDMSLKQVNSCYDFLGPLSEFGILQ